MALLQRSGFVEVPMGMPLRQIVMEIGGGVPPGLELKAVQIGGLAGGWLAAAELDIALDYEQMVSAGCTSGFGIFTGCRYRCLRCGPGPASLDRRPQRLLRQVHLRARRHAPVEGHPDGPGKRTRRAERSRFASRSERRDEGRLLVRQRQERPGRGADYVAAFPRRI